MKQDSVMMPYGSFSLLGKVYTHCHHHVKQVMIRDHLKQVGNTLTFDVLSPKGYNVPLSKHGKQTLMMSQGSDRTREAGGAVYRPRVHPFQAIPKRKQQMTSPLS